MSEHHLPQMTAVPKVVYQIEFGSAILTTVCILAFVAALFVVPIFTGGKIESTIRWLFVVNGILGIVAGIAYLLTANPLHILVLASLVVWSIAFPIATILLAVVLKRAERMNVREWIAWPTIQINRPVTRYARRAQDVLAEANTTVLPRQSPRGSTPAANAAAQTTR